MNLNRKAIARTAMIAGLSAAGLSAAACTPPQTSSAVTVWESQPAPPVHYDQLNLLMEWHTAVDDPQEERPIDMQAFPDRDHTEQVEWARQRCDHHGGVLDWTLASSGAAPRPYWLICEDIDF